MDSTNSDSSVLTSSSFSDIPFLNSRFVSNLQYHGYSNLTKIQSLAIPILNDHKNALICSPTGSGKTFTFLIPAINHLLNDDTPNKSRKDGTRILIISPTRELTQQTCEIASKLTQLWPWIVVGSITGGEKKKAEKSSLRKGVTLLCVTPGRMLDHLESTSSFIFTRLNCFILDEVDRLLDMGFESKIKSIYSRLEGKTEGRFQKVLISATLNSKVEELAAFCLSADESFVPINILDEKFQVPITLQHKYVVAPGRFKLLILISLLIRCKKAVVFVSNCTAVDYFHNLLSIVTWPNELFNAKAKVDGEILNQRIFKIHGKIPLEDRVGFMSDFTSSSTGILIATDVASRGLNLNVDLVIQFDPPQQLEEYIHRSGRTARLENTGTAILVLLESEIGLLGLLHEKYVYPTQISVEELYSNLYNSKFIPKYRNPKNLLPMMLRHFRHLVSNDEDLSKLANDAYLCSVKAYRTIVPQLRRALNFKKLHLGHMAASFNLSHTPSQACSINASRDDMTRSNKRKIQFSIKNRRLKFIKTRS